MLHDLGSVKQIKSLFEAVTLDQEENSAVLKSKDTDPVERNQGYEIGSEATL